MKNKNRFVKLALLLFFYILAAFVSLNAQTSNEYLVKVDKMPEIVGGMGEIAKNLVYPPNAKQAHVEGKVFVLILINENGKSDDVKVVKGIGMGCDEEAVKAVKKLTFVPGQLNGQNVKVKMALAIDFKIQ